MSSLLAAFVCVGACSSNDSDSELPQGGTPNQTTGGTGATVTTGGTGTGAAMGEAGMGTGGVVGEDETGGTPGDPATGGTGGSLGSGGTGGTSGGAGPGDGDTSRCNDASLVWKTGNKTHYTSWPDPGSDECIIYNGCTWAGYFAHCSGQRSEDWVAARNIAAVFPDDGVEAHDICIRSGDRVMVVTAIDTCGDSDCNGCCTQNKGSADALIDLESYTNARWGLADGSLEWADLGPNPQACAE